MASPAVPVVQVRVGDVLVLMEAAEVRPMGTEPTGVGERAADWLLTTFDRVQGAVEQVAVSTAQMVGRAAARAARPDVVQVEFGVKVSAKGDVIIAGGSGEASLKVTLTYHSPATVKSGQVAGSSGEKVDVDSDAGTTPVSEGAGGGQ